MIRFGEFNKLKVIRKADFGYFLNADTGNTKDDILLPIRNVLNNNIEMGEDVDAFIYRDSEDRPIATLKKPFAQVGDIALLEVVSLVPIGAFVGFGLERDIFVPIKEQKYALSIGEKYLFYIYLDKSNRLAATTDIDNYLLTTDQYEIGKEVSGIVYGFQTNNSALVAVENLYKGVILKNEYYTELTPGEEVKVRVKKYYEEGQIGLTPRQGRMYERDILETKIMDYLIGRGGSMPFNDKSSPEDIKIVFGTSKSYFKNALGGLMKKGMITQTDTRTLIKK